MRNLPAALAISLLAGCAGSNSVEPISPPPSLTLPCKEPSDLPDRSINDQEIEVFWGRDRSALRECTSRHQGLVTWLNEARPR